MVAHARHRADAVGIHVRIPVAALPGQAGAQLAAQVTIAAFRIRVVGVALLLRRDLVGVVHPQLEAAPCGRLQPITRAQIDTTHFAAGQVERPALDRHQPPAAVTIHPGQDAGAVRVTRRVRPRRTVHVLAGQAACLAGQHFVRTDVDDHVFQLDRPVIRAHRQVRQHVPDEADRPRITGF
ncbi:hypothetical protein D3C81_863820 [compost metagenome]